MSKYEELCQAYAIARKQYRESCQACQEFVEVFMTRMSDYFGCPIEKQDMRFDEDGWLHFNISIAVCENPKLPEKGDCELVKFTLSVQKILDNFIVMVYPYGNTFKVFADEFNKFEEIYEFIFEKIKDSYIGPNPCFSRRDNPF